MTWAKLSDDFHDHDKLDGLGPEGIALWTLVLSSISARTTDGFVSVRTVRDMAHRGELVDGPAAARRLVERGLWHDAKALRRCEDCRAIVARLPAGRLGPGEFYVHDFLTYNPASAEVLQPDARWKAARAKRLLRDKELCQALKERDRWCCRYCGRRVDFADRRTELGGTYDHVDPACRDNTLETVVVACRGCNVAKGDRTPREAGMPLLPIPDPAAELLEVDRRPSGRDLTPARSGSDPDLIGVRSDPTPLVQPGGVGTGRIGARPGSDPGLIPGQNPERGPGCA